MNREAGEKDTANQSESSTARGQCQHCETCHHLPLHAEHAILPCNIGRVHLECACITANSVASGRSVPKEFVGCDHEYWGDGDGNPISDPNPRLEILIDAARRGAKVRVLLHCLFGAPNSRRSNQAMIDYLAAVAAAEGIDIVGAVGTPTGGAVHMTRVLVKVDGATWTALDSLNGGEISHKVNREVILIVDLPLVYDRFLEVFLYDCALVLRYRPRSSD